MALTEGQSLTLTETRTLRVTLLLINTNEFPWDEALLHVEHRHLGQTCSHGIH